MEMFKKSIDLQGVLDESKFAVLRIFVLTIGNVKIPVCEAD